MNKADERRSFQNSDTSRYTNTHASLIVWHTLRTAKLIFAFQKSVINLFFFNCALALAFTAFEIKEMYYEGQRVELYLEYVAGRKMAVKFSGLPSLRRILNGTLKHDESFIEIARGRREKRELPERDSKILR